MVLGSVVSICWCLLFALRVIFSFSNVSSYFLCLICRTWAASLCSVTPVDSSLVLWDSKIQQSLSVIFPLLLTPNVTLKQSFVVFLWPALSLLSLFDQAWSYSAATLFNCLDTDLKQIACVSPSSIIFSSRLNNFKHKLFILFLKFASNVSHLEELMCYDCRFSLYCNCIRR